MLRPQLLLIAATAAVLALAVPHAFGQEAEVGAKTPLPATSSLLSPLLESGQDQGRAEGGTSGSEEPLETDRDAYTPSTRLAGKGRLIVESAYSFLDNRDVPDTHSFPEMYLRYGLTERIELRLGWNYEVGGRSTAVSGALTGETGEVEPRVEHASFLFYGIKLAMTAQDRLVPESAFMVQGLTPTSGAGTTTEIVLDYVFGWKLTNDWKIDSSMRVVTASPTGAVWSPSTVLRIPLGDRWGVHAEYFGQFSQDHTPVFVHHFFSPGVRYLVTPDFELGVRVGVGLNEQTTTFFANVGFGYRF
jgi:hypothetical protein